MNRKRMPTMITKTYMDYKFQGIKRAKKLIIENPNT